MTQSSGATINSNSLLGKIIFGRYLLERKVGQGGMAWVFRAKDLETEETVAAKILLPHIAESPDLRDRFLREARIQAKLEHSSIVQLYDAGEEEGVIGIIIEWIEGETLLELIKRFEKPLPLKETISLFIPVLDALNYAHELQMVHRDIKPENVMVHWEDGVPYPKLADFGLAKIVDEIEDNQTKTGMIMGTLKYMAPEQVNATKHVDRRADIYSMGIVLYTMVTLQPPFSGSMQEMLVAILHEGVKDPRTIDNNVPDGIADVIMQAVHKDPEQRFQTCAAFIAALQASSGEEVDELGDTAGGIPVLSKEDFTILTPPPPKPVEEVEPLPSGSFSADSFGDVVKSRSKRLQRAPVTGSSETEVVDASELLGGQKSSNMGLNIGVLVVLLLLGGGAAWKMGLFGEGKPEERDKPLVGGACKQGQVRPCFTSSDGTKGPDSAKKKGICKAGYQLCVAGAFGTCIGAVLPRKEKCNGKDDDCDGKIDEPFADKGKNCSQSDGECKSVGTWVCNKDQSALSCQIDPSKNEGAKQVRLAFSPSDQEFRFRYQRNNKIVKSSYCIDMGKRRSISVKIKAPGYYTCRIRLRASKTPIKINMRRRSRNTLEPSRSYCKR